MAEIRCAGTWIAGSAYPSTATARSAAVPTCAATATTGCKKIQLSDAGSSTIRSIKDTAAIPATTGTTSANRHRQRTGSDIHIVLLNHATATTRTTTETLSDIPTTASSATTPTNKENIERHRITVNNNRRRRIERQQSIRPTNFRASLADTHKINGSN